MKTEEELKGKGYIHSSIPRLVRPKKDKLVFKAGTPTPFDWSKGYDVEKELATTLNQPNFRLPVKDQGQSSSCGGQSSSSLASVLQTLLTKNFEERSARDIYSHVFYAGGGTTSDRLEKLLLTRGVATEAIVSSYQNGAAPTEAYMTVKQETPDVLNDAINAIEETSVSINFSSIDSIAQGIRDCHGVVCAFQGSNNGTWLSANPQPPKDGQELWGHYVYLGKASLLNGRKTISFLNSWGKDTGIQGWQTWDETYVNSGYLKDCFGMVDTSILVPKSQQNALQTILLLCQKQLVVLLMRLRNLYVVAH